MTAVSTRDALAKRLHDRLCECGQECLRPGAEWLAHADALFASGAVVDAATLADELRSMGDVWGGDAMWVTTGTKVADLMAESVVAHLAEGCDQ